MTSHTLVQRLAMMESDEDLYRSIDDVLSFVDLVVPGKIVMEEDTIGDVFGCAAVRRLADLLRAETALARSDNAATSRVIGRTAMETWLWAVYLFLDPERAVDRLVAESGGHDRWRLVGENRMWERIASLRTSDLDDPEPAPSRAGIANPNIRQLAEATADAMRSHGYNGDRADGKYHNEYRWDSMHDAHPNFDLLMRYFDLDAGCGTATATIFPTAQPRDDDVRRGVGGAFDTARLLLEALGIYSRKRNVRVERRVVDRMKEIAAMEGR
jgi:hypothetical protein